MQIINNKNDTHFISIVMYDTTFDENTSPFCTNSLLHSRDISEFPVNLFVIHVLLYVPQNIKE